MAEPYPLRVLVVSPDVSLLHEIAWMLNAVGYGIETSADASEDAPWRRYSLADIILIDGRAVAEPNTGTLSLGSDNPCYCVVLHSSAGMPDLSAWYAAGVHDVLRVPPSRGEMLARMRAAARYLEFERRLQQRSLRSTVLGFYTRRGFLRRLERLAETDAGVANATLVTVSIDWFTGIRRKCGETASRNLIHSAARAIRRTAGDNAICAYLGQGRFAALLAGQSVEATKVLVESLAGDFRSRDSLPESTPRPTLCSAVTPWMPTHKSVDQLLNDGLETLTLAEQSGGDCAVTYGEFREQLTNWQHEMSTGNPFADVVAQDIMEPFPALLNCDSDQHELAAALRRMQFPFLPYVDSEGHLVGVADDVEAVKLGIRDDRGSRTCDLTKPVTVPHIATFAEIYETFSTRSCTSLVVVDNERPLGYITFDGFLSMIEPVHSETFAQAAPPVDELAYLAVPAIQPTGE